MPIKISIPVIASTLLVAVIVVLATLSLYSGAWSPSWSPFKGSSQQIFDKAKINLINAYITDKNDKFRMVGEGCLSLPHIRVDTRRYKEITINNNGKTENYEGLLAIAIQHEVDHCNGMIILDRKWKAR